LAPQCEQNFSPANIVPKHDGQVTVARIALQKSHRVAADETAAPQEGHRNVSTGMTDSTEMDSIIETNAIVVYGKAGQVF
jgi:hypothetical protein